MFTDPQEKLDNKLRALVYRGRTRPLNNRDLRDMEAVLKQGANPNARESKNISILQSAMSHRVFDAAQLLIKYGADCHATNSHGNNALTQAISQGRKGLIKTILDHDKDVKNLINTHNSEGKSPLHYLLYRKDCYDLIPELIKYTHPLHHGYIDTALWMAHENAYDLAIDMLQTCIQADTKNTLPGAPLLLDKIKQNKEEGKKTARSYCRQDILKNIGYFIYSAHHNNDTDTLKTLFDHVVTHDISVHDLKVNDDKAVYPLSIALVRTDTELCKTALKFKDIDHHINEKGTETLFKALTNSQEDFAILLIKNGVDYNLGMDWQTPLYLAIYLGLTKVIETLLEQDDICLTNADENHTLVYTAMDKGMPDLALKLIQMGSPITENKKHPSHLTLAAKNGYTALVKELLNSGADPHTQTSGKTPIHFADNPEIKELLATAMKKPIWIKTHPDEIARITHSVALSRETTEIFNFTAKHVTTTICNKKTNAESSFQRDFNDHSNQETILTACDEINKRGGHISPATLFNTTTQKNTQKIKIR